MVSCVIRPVLFGVAATLLGRTVAVSGPWEQCGGIGFSGDVDCTTGYTCVVQNDFYSQCISSDAAPRSSTRKPTSTLVTSVKASSSAKVSPTANASSSVKPTATASPSTGGAACTGTFTPVSASAFVAAMSPGWNLGNTLDAVQNEGDWNNPPVVASTFDDIKASGIKGIRLPVTWAYHFTSQSPTWTVDPVWLQRVSDVVDMITSRGFYTIVNVHHDSWVWADVTASGANITAIEERFYKLWYQIGTKLACKGSQVAFESINEPPGTTAEHGAEINKLNTIFLQAINDAGGFNAKRVVTLVGAGEDSIKTSQWFKAPDAKFTNPWAIQYHYYSPYDFTFAAWGKTTWGSASDKAALESDLAAIRGNFTDIPLIIGEWSATTIYTEAAARWKYYDAFVRAATKYKTGIVLWDNGVDQFDRTTHTWRDPVALSILLNATKGTPNALPESTTDGTTPQTSSAYIFHRQNASVGPATLGFELNGNTLVSASLGTKQLARGTDYAVSGKDVTFSAAFLSTLLSPSTAPGPVGTIALGFSAGAALAVQVVQYGTPVLGATSSKVPAASADILIPVTWAGVPRVAAVRALTADGAILVDDWTQWLPELQRGRLTYSNHWDWDATHVILKAGVVDAVKAAGKNVVFTFEFWPREAGNVANYTLTV